MKKTIPVLCLATLLCACKKNSNEPYAYEQSTIYSESSNVNFNSISLDLKPYILDNNVKKYLVGTSLQNVTITMDDEPFGSRNSFLVDTSIISKQVVNNYYVTTEDVNFAVNVFFQTEDKPIATAGDYSDLLNNIVILSPGNYHCRIVSFEIKMANGATKKVFTNITRNFEVKAGAKNYYMGEFEVLVK